MSDNDNPFKAPETVATVNSAGGDMPLPDNLRLPLLKSAPWQKFVGIMAFVFSGVIALVGLFFMVGFTALTSSLGSAGLGAGMSIFLGAIYIAMGLLYFFPGLYLYRSSKALKNYRETESSAELAASFGSMSKFWKFIGVLAIIGAVGMAISIIFMVIAGIASAF